jgi:hypothetical protein
MLYVPSSDAIIPEITVESASFNNKTFANGSG